MTTKPVKPFRPVRGGFLRPFGCGTFIREFLLGRGPQGAPSINPNEGAPQADVFYEYKQALLRATALDRATRTEERQARREGRGISPEAIETLADRILARLPYRTRYARYSSFVKYFGQLQRLGWVAATGREEPSAFQTNYPPGPPRRWYRLTSRGRRAGLVAWTNPKAAEYPEWAPAVPPTPPPAAPAVPERPRRPAAPPAPPPPPPTAPAPARPPTAIPAFEVAEKPTRAAAQRLITHLRKVEKREPDSPDVKAELERLSGEVSGWAELVGEDRDEEDAKEEPNEDKLDTLQDRLEALENAAEQMEAGDVADAIGTLDDAWPPPKARAG
ncbi:MAG: hypothetical protein Q8O40_05785 [Chloroflexota bacterium]|nr:hypothetical protein [Chloroflexota bacterium]